MSNIKLYRPVKSNFPFQKFGENLACIKVDDFGKAIRPYQVLPGTFPGTCPIGSKKFYPDIGLKGHNGEDWGLYYSEPIYFNAITDIPVRWQVLNEVDMDGGIGVNVYALDPVPFDALPIHDPGSLRMIENQYNILGGKLFPMFKFWHCLKTFIPDHGIIKPGDMIALGDSTGASSGNHLHWSMKIHGGSTNGFGFSIDSDNGYTGAFDQSPYYKNDFILDVLDPKFKFLKDLRQGIFDTDVGVLQSILVKYKDMQPILAEETGYYGPKTRKGVLAFQIRNNIPLTWYEKNVMAGNVVGPKTRVVLNTL